MITLYKTSFQSEEGQRNFPSMEHRIFGCIHQQHGKRGMLQIQENTLRLTRWGIFISDGIMSDLMWVE